MGLKSLLKDNKATTKMKMVEFDSQEIYIRQMSLTEASMVASSENSDDGTWFALKTCLVNKDGKQSLCEEDKPLIMEASNNLVFRLLREINDFNIPSEELGKN